MINLRDLFHAISTSGISPDVSQPREKVTIIIDGSSYDYSGQCVGVDGSCYKTGLSKVDVFGGNRQHIVSAKLCKHCIAKLVVALAENGYL